MADFVQISDRRWVNMDCVREVDMGKEGGRLYLVGTPDTEFVPVEKAEQAERVLTYLKHHQGKPKPVRGA